MLEEYEKKSTLLLLGGKEDNTLDLEDMPQIEKQQRSSGSSDYEGMFD